MIETDVPGDPASVRAAAGWLRVTLRGNTATAGNHQADARSVALAGWEGRAADGYRSATGPVLAATDNHVDRIGRAATALEEYAARLARLEEFMADLRTRAVAGGLTLAGTVIQPPPPAPATVAAPGSPEAAAHQAQLDRIALYNTLAADAEAEWATFTGWSDAHLAAAVADASETDDVEALTDTFDEHLTNALPGIGLGIAGLGLRHTADAFRADAAEIRRRSRVSGDPRIRGLADTPEGRSQLDELMRSSRHLGRAGKFMGPLGIGLDVYSGVQEAQESGDWTRASITTGASIGTGLVIGGAVALGLVSAPALVVVLGGGALAAGVSYGAGWIYDHHEEIADWTGDRVDDVQDFAAGTWDDATDVAGDAWDAVTPW